MADPQIHTPPLHVLPQRIGSSVTKGVHINRKVLPKLGEHWEPSPLGGGVTDHIKTKPPSHKCYHVKFGSFWVKGCVHK